MMSTRMRMLVPALLFALTGWVVAAPLLIDYQGYLKDGGGTLVDSIWC